VVEEKFVPTEAQLKNIIADTQVFDKDMEILVDIYSRFEKLKKLAMENRKLIETVGSHDIAIETLDANQRHLVSEFKKLDKERREVSADLKKHENEIGKTWKFMEELDARVTRVETMLVKHSESLDRNTQLLEEVKQLLLTSFAKKEARKPREAKPREAKPKKGVFGRLFGGK